MSNVVATYRIKAKADLNKQAEQIALGLTVGSWTSLPLVDQEQLRAHKGHVVSAQYIDDQYAKLAISYPAVNFTNDLPAILTTTFGKLSLDGEVKLLDLDFSNELAAAFPGPAFGIEGIRKQVDVYDRPLFMSIFKGVIGRTLEDLAEQMRQQALGGVDLVKDDEILFENEATPIEKRVKTNKEVLRQVYESTGKRTLYAVNVTGPTRQLVNQAEKAQAAGADALLFNVFSYGLDALQMLREAPEVHLPIMAHPAFSGAMISAPNHGVSTSLLLGKLLRMAGADFSLFPSPYGSVAMPREEALSLKEALVDDQSPWKRTFPVPSAGIHPGLVPQLIADFGLDSIINAGGGTHGHPDGAEGGGKAFHAAIRATLDGVPLEKAAEGSEPLAKAIQQWGH
ncbi:2,3-diketo-5-methylthiopentyl-1-phosphate enolase [Aureibacillus halotolerans]|uniref:2,3-diketo-5-methylthiopentyl-1-phosphate enolase n=1 Tax=Aureibacillus halotolerans TaxID=1508390 RepID=A0A4R6U334_9BACI|nr:2,3-diketo-5-methylthiopentyl-1-phosphate enolase [Aureibacillus halotolerans]TDQ39792.1 2,3-diketo-5-methylthiopentyl-1-phosphate enolase [Aureibacillus halotolerans]